MECKTNIHTIDGRPLDYERLDEELDWAEALLARRSENITREFRESLKTAVKRGLKYAIIEKPVASGTPELVAELRLNEELVDILCTLEAGDVEVAFGN